MPPNKANKRKQRRKRRIATRRVIRAKDGRDEFLLCSDEPVALIEAAQGDGEAKLPQFRMSAYTGGRMRPAYFSRDVVVDLSMVSVLGGKRPILLDHNASQIVGHSEEINVSDKGITVNGVVSGTGDAAQTVVGTAKNGFPWRASIGASVTGTMDVIGDGESVTVNGKKFKGPLYVARGIQLREVSFVPLAADDKTRATVRAKQIGETDMGFNAWLKANGFDAESLSEEQRDILKAAWHADQSGDDPAGTPAPPQDPAQPAPVQAAAAPEHSGTDEGQRDVVAGIREQAASEEERQQAIRQIAASYSVSQLTLDDDRQVPFVAHAIREGWTTDHAELEALRASRPAAPAFHASRDQAGIGQTLEASMLIRCGVPEAQVGKWYGEQTMNAAVSREHRGAGIRTVIEQLLAATGRHVRLDQMTDDTIRAAFQADREITAAGGFSTVSLSGILGNVANKALLAAYMAVNAAIPKIAAAVDHNDFKQHTRYRLTMAGEFAEVGPDGELKSAQPGEDSYTNQLGTYGRVVTLTRQDIVNDDLGAFLQIPRMLGRKAALKIEKVGFTLLLSNPSSFFGSGNANYFSGATSALGVDSLTTAIQKFLDQTDSNGDPILVEPSLLLVPTALKGTADNLMSSEYLITGSTSKVPSRNIHAGRFTTVSSPYLNSQSLTGSSSTAWYLLANPADIAVMEIAYLRGRRVPTIESAEVDFVKLGMQWRGYFDFGIALQDPRAGVMSKGAA